MNKQLIYGIVFCLFMVIAPHADHLPMWVSSVCTGVLLWRIHVAYAGKSLPRRWLLSLISLAGMTGIVLDFHTIFGREAGVTLLILLSTLKLLELHSRRDAMVLMYLACFIIITNFFYSQSIPTALYLLASMIVIISTWVHLQVQDIALVSRLRIAGVLLLQAIPLTLILFVLFPRVPGPLWGLPQDAYASSGLDDRMSPGSLSRLSLSEAVAFRVAFDGSSPKRNQMYWRGPVLWYFDGRTWLPGITQSPDSPVFTDVSQPVDYTVTLEPHNKPWLFALDVPVKLSARASVTSDFQVMNRVKVHARMRYTARSDLVYHANVEETQLQLKRALQLPVQGNPRARELAATWKTQDRNNADIVNTALRYFNQQGFVYTLEPPLLGSDTVDDFLFDTKQGFCEHYASAFVFLMRAAGVPARVVTGYLGGEYNDIGNYYIVRQSDAHAWAEVWLRDQGWVRVDPTGAIAPDRVERGLSAAVADNAVLPFMERDPPQWMRSLRFNLDSIANYWNQWVLGYDSERQFAFLTRLGMESISWQKMAIDMLGMLGIVIGLFSLYMLRHLFARSPDRVQAAWLKLCRRLARAGLPRAAHEGARDYAERVAHVRPELAVSFRELAAVYTALRYGKAGDERQQRDFLQRAASFKT